MELKSKITREQLVKYLHSLRENGVSLSDLEIKTANVENFIDWAYQRSYLNKDVFKQLKNEIANFKLKPKEAEKTVPQIQTKKPPLQRYIAFLILVIFMSALGAGIYSRFFANTKTPYAYPSSFTFPESLQAQKEPYPFKADLQTISAIRSPQKPTLSSTFIMSQPAVLLSIRDLVRA
jgi:hypothetical protein